MIKLNSIVTYKQPFPDEIYPDGTPVTFTVIGIEESTNWALLMANVDMNIKPTETANLSDIKLLN